MRGKYNLGQVALGGGFAAVLASGSVMRTTLPTPRERTIAPFSRADVAAQPLSLTSYAGTQALDARRRVESGVALNPGAQQNAAGHWVKFGCP